MTVVIYDTDQQVRSSATFRGADGEFQTPDELAVSLVLPDGTVRAYTMPTLAIVQDSIGGFHFDFVPDVPGFWQVQWEGSGTDLDLIEAQTFVVREARIP